MSMNEKWNKGISLRKKRWISMIMAAVMIVTLVPFMPGKKAGKVEAAGYNIAAAVAYAKEWGGSKRNPAYKEYDGDCANFVSQCLKAGGLNVYDTWVPTLKDKLQAMGYTIIMNPTADQVDVGDVMFYDSTYTGEINHTTIITSKVNGVPKITGHTSDVIDGYYTNGSACPWQYGNYTCAAILHTSGISGEMTTPTITTNRECYIVGDKINITWNKTSSQSDFLHYWLIITNTDTGEECFGGATGSNGDVNANSYQFTIPEEGHYRIDIYAIPYNDKEHRQKEAVKTVSTYGYDSSIVNLGDDFYANIINTGNGKYLTADSDDNVTIRTASGQKNQLWHFRKRESGSYEIINNASDKALDDTNWGQENETNVGVYTRNNTTAQKWFVRGTEGAYFINASCGDAVLDIDSNGSADGTNVWLYEKNESSAQKFTIKKVATSLDTCNALGLTTIQGGFRLSWDTVSGATKYEVYRKKVTDSDYSRIAVVSGEDIDTYEDKNCISGITYEYRVNAANDYCLGASGAECHGLYLDSTNASLVKYSADSVNISWNSVRGADGYNIYLYNQNDDTYSKVKDIANGSTTSCVIAGLKQNTTYTYLVEAYGICTYENKNEIYTGCRSNILTIATKRILSNLAVKMSDWDLSGTASQPVLLGNDGNGAVTYTYAPEGSDVFTAEFPTKAGTYTVKAEVAETDRYCAGVATCTFTITDNNSRPAPVVKKSLDNLVLILDDWDISENASTPILTGNLGNGAVTYSYASVGSTEYTSAIPTKAGTYIIKAVVAETNEYYGGVATCKFTITDKYSSSQPVTKKSLNNLVLMMAGWHVGDRPSSPVLTGNDGKGKVTYTYSKVGSNKYSNTVPSNEGKYIIKAYVAETEDYYAGTATCVFEITKKPVVKKTQTITTNAANYTLVYGGKSVTIKAKTNGNGKKSYKSSNNNVVSIDKTGKMIVKNTGKVTVSIYVAATTAYKAATKKVTVVVKPKIQAIKGIKSQKKSSIYVKYVKDTKVSGYEIQTALDSKFKKSVNTYTIKPYSKYRVTLTKKRTGKIYYVRVRSYKIVGSQKIYGSYSGIKKIKVK
ncbi:hypothetical protein DWW70_11380 [Coprococcus sp. AF16-5]|uniref:RICIN domain-containing protein n=1 Tax=Coprococcus sp. AF16-5 TaxID=2293088 RepID=UPI000E4C7A53|nr:RICIN domain-containing protein [Coprococcus sp. AF16-5]RHR65119.1 hypothetical protein DWW70_11380 [Coprococcus sp. AF16-5]